MGTGADNWDQHWQEFGAVAELGPTPKYRRRLIWKLLGIYSQGESVRMLEVGSGTGEFATPWGLTVDSQMRIYVADTKNRRMVTLRL